MSENPSVSSCLIRVRQTSNEHPRNRFFEKKFRCATSDFTSVESLISELFNMPVFDLAQARRKTPVRKNSSQEGEGGHITNECEFLLSCTPRRFFRHSF